MRGRRSHSRHSAFDDAPLNHGMRLSVYVLAPSIRPMKSSSTYRLMPSTIDTTAMRNITAIVTPRRVKKDFSF